MKFFNHRKNTSIATVPEEVQDYYQSEQRDRVGMAWLLALGTLVVTLIVAAGLFFGGRWLYRVTTHKKPATPPQTAQQGTSSTNTEQVTNNQGAPSNEGASQQQQPSETPKQPAASQPSSAPAPTTLVNTGPDE